MRTEMGLYQRLTNLKTCCIGSFFLYMRVVIFSERER